MKKVAIITLCGNTNYGNKLQNYALKKEIEKNNCIAETIWIENSFKGNQLKLFLKMLKNKYKDIKDYHRTKYFKKFNKMYLNIAKRKIIFNNDVDKLGDNYDYFVVGSDQVWNCNLFNNFNIYFMLNIPKKKCFSYAASFSLNQIPKSVWDKYNEGLNHMNYISVRENRGKEIVEEIAHRNDAEVLIDPTMLLDATQWDKIIKKPTCLKSNRYILNYFLGNLSEKRKKEIDRIAKENGCEVINILDSNGPFIKTGPSEFLYLIKNAFLVCTDSFHSCVFSILYNRPFVVFDREGNGLGLNSRIETLLNKFKLKNRKFEGKISNENLNADYIESYSILDKEREKARKFLDSALNSK